MRCATLIEEQPCCMLSFEPEKHQARRGSIDHMTQQ
jgi:hypothetical protein